MNAKIKQIEIDKALKVVISLSVTQDKKIYMHVFEVNIEGSNLLENDDNKIIIEELGPNAILSIRRNLFAAD